MNDSLNFWKKCSTCKKPIAFGAAYYVCSVSTCRRKRTGLSFCSVSCWDGHLGFANHRESFAEEAVAPMTREEEAPTSAPREKRRIIRDAPATSGLGGSQHVQHNSKRDVDTLVVVSKVKQFVKNESDFNTSQCAIDALTQKVVQECLKGIENANTAGRKTLMGRDIE